MSDTASVSAVTAQNSSNSSTVHSETSEPAFEFPSVPKSASQKSPADQSLPPAVPAAAPSIPALSSRNITAGQSGEMALSHVDVDVSMKAQQKIQFALNDLRCDDVQSCVKLLREAIAMLTVSHG